MKTNRWNQIEYILKIQKEASVSELASMLKVSEMTIRRDLMELEKEGRVTRYHGGAFISAAGLQNVLPAYHPETCPQEKEQIGSAGKEYLKKILAQKEASSVTFMSGSTMQSMVEKIDFTIPVTAIVDNLYTAQTIAQNANNSIIQLGGRLEAPSLNVSGYLAEQMLNYLSLDYTFMGTAALDFDGYLYCFYDSHASFVEKLLTNSRHIVVLADYTKLGSSSLVKITSMNHKFTLITNQSADKQILENYQRLGVEIILA